MKRLIALAAVAACHPTQPPPVPLPPLAPATGSAQSAPPAGPVAAAPPVTAQVDGDVTDGWTHGIHVLVKRIPGAETTATGLYIAGGAMTWTKETAGLEDLALAVATNGGTEQLDKDAFTKRLADLGSSIDSSAAEDYSSIDAWSLRPAWDDTFVLLVQTFREPALPATQLEIERRQQLAQLAHELDDPDSRLELLADAAMYKDHPYAIRADGTIGTVTGFTGAQVADQLVSLRQASRLLVVVVGDVDARHVLDTVGRSLGDLPHGSYEPRPVPALPPPTRGLVDVEADKLPTNYIEAEVPGPRWGDPDFAVARVAMTWLSQREFEEVRTKRNLSYAPGASFAWSSAVPLASLYVTAVDPKTTMKVMLDEARRMREAKMSAHDLAATKAMLLTRTFRSEEAPADQAAELASAQLHGGDWRFVRQLPQLVDAVTADQVQAWSAAHLSHFHTFVIGDAAKIDRAVLEAF